MDTGARIRAARLEKGLTQTQLGEILGVQKSAIAKYESGRVVNIKRSTMQLLSEVLSIPPHELLANEKAEKNSDIPQDIAERMRTDDDFLFVVKKLHSLDADKFAGVKQMLQAFVE